MLDSLKIALQYITPKHLLSRCIGKLAAAEAGVLTTTVIKLFIKQYKVDMTEALEPDPEAYASFNAFFTRLLKEDARSICSDRNKLALPVDGAVSQLGQIKYDSVFQAKGHDYSLTTLLGGKPEISAPFLDGKFATIYLSPKDYHRIHMPIDGQLTDMLYIPGELFSVSPLTAERVPGLFARNERVVAIFDTEIGKMAMVLVGATIVASIETKWAGTISPPSGKHVEHWTYPTDGENSVMLKKGDEMGLFKLGSTIVACFEADSIDFADLAAGDVTRLGDVFATIKK
ncbi:archaetidylserine decarboxylase [Paraglaciecola sp. 2405UD69-4]|uniref:archaetidylserine decarboxylase n=1 Tax=Paraglaciecola sp. 2405UD69-4 TaxID=3391836 RepID=UPI0039C90721